VVQEGLFEVRTLRPCGHRQRGIGPPTSGARVVWGDDMGKLLSARQGTRSCDPPVPRGANRRPTEAGGSTPGRSVRERARIAARPRCSFPASPRRYRSTAPWFFAAAARGGSSKSSASSTHSASGEHEPLFAIRAVTARLWSDRSSPVFRPPTPCRRCSLRSNSRARLIRCSSAPRLVARGARPGASRIGERPRVLRPASSRTS